MLLEFPCKQGKVQVDEATLRVTAPFGRVVWQVPREKVQRFTTQPGMMLSVNVTVHTEQGAYQAEMVTQPNFAKLQALFSNVETAQGPKPAPQPVRRGNKWYHDPARLTYIGTYTDEKQMRKEVEEAAQFGWVPSGTTATAGHVNIGRTLIGASLTGGASLFLGGSRSKDKITITFLRSQEWQAQNR